MNTIKQKYMKEEIQYLLDNNFIQQSKSAWSSPCILVSKPDNSYRLCTDNRKVNNVTKTDSFPIPLIEDFIDQIGNANYITNLISLKDFGKYLSQREQKKYLHSLLQMDYFSII